jgi:hypothetical protein
MGFPEMKKEWALNQDETKFKRPGTSGAVGRIL